MQLQCEKRNFRNSLLACQLLCIALRKKRNFRNSPLCITYKYLRDSILAKFFSIQYPMSNSIHSGLVENQPNPQAGEEGSMRSHSTSIDTQEEPPADRPQGFEFERRHVQMMALGILFLFFL